MKTVDMKNANLAGSTSKSANKFPAAACNVCGGWTSFGGMSQKSKGSEGCVC